MKTNLENYEERFVDYMEGQLDADEMREVEAFVAQHPELEEDFKLFCGSKLVPDTSVVYTKKESLMQPATVIRPLYVRIIAAAACLALLIGVGIHFLKPHHGFVQQPPIASLTPIEARPIAHSQEPSLRTSSTKAPRIARTAAAVTPAVSGPQATEVLAPIDLIASVNPISPKPLQWEEGLAYNDVETGMFIELGERLTALGPINQPEPLIEGLLNDQKEQVVASLNENVFGDVRETTRSLYKKAVKTVVDVYLTANYRIDEAKDQLVASR